MNLTARRFWWATYRTLFSGRRGRVLRMGGGRRYYVAIGRRYHFGFAAKFAAQQELPGLIVSDNGPTLAPTE